MIQESQITPTTDPSLTLVVTRLPMRHLAFNFIISFFLINTNGYASQMHYKQADTTTPENIIKEQMRNFKKQNRVQIHKFEK